MHHERLAEHKRCHLGIRRVVEDGEQRMPRHPLPSLAAIGVHMKWQARDRLREDAHAGIHRRRLHRREFVDPLPRRRPSEEERRLREAVTVLRLVAGAKEGFQELKHTRAS